MTPLTPAGQALAALLAEADIRWPDDLTRLHPPALTPHIANIERQAADRALAELRREVEGIRGGAEADRCNARVLALIDKASKPEEGA